MTKRKDYTVGKGKPPKNTRFKKGQSGNPKGRPKGSKGALKILDDALREKVQVMENGRPRIVSKLELAITQLVNTAATGDPKALQRLLPLIMVMEGKKEQEAVKEAVDDATDELVMHNLRKRLKMLDEEEND